MSFVQNRGLGGGFAQLLAPSGGSFSTSTSSSVLYNRSAQRDPFMFSSPTSSTMAGSGDIFLSPSVNSRTGFRSSQIGSTILNPPESPKNPMMPYLRDSPEMYEKVRAGSPESQLWDVGRTIGQIWRESPEGSRQAYTEEYETEKQDNDRALNAYHHSPAYQAYLESQNIGVRSNEKSSAVSTSAKSGVYIKPVDEDEGSRGNEMLQQYMTPNGEFQKARHEISKCMGKWRRDPKMVGKQELAHQYIGDWEAAWMAITICYPWNGKEKEEFRRFVREHAVHMRQFQFTEQHWLDSQLYQKQRKITQKLNKNNGPRTHGIYHRHIHRGDDGVWRRTKLAPAARRWQEANPDLAGQGGQ